MRIRTLAVKLLIIVAALGAPQAWCKSGCNGR